jgi:hypothetical protein
LDSSSLENEPKSYLDIYNNRDFSYAYKSVFSKSPNQAVLSGERSIRNVDLINPTKSNTNLSGYENSIQNNNITSNSIGKKLMNKSYMNNSSDSFSKSILSMSTVFPPCHIPTGFIGKFLVGSGFDKSSGSNLPSPMLSSKEDLSPGYIFNTH